MARRAYRNTPEDSLEIAYLLVKERAVVFEHGPSHLTVTMVYRAKDLTEGRYQLFLGVHAFGLTHGCVGGSFDHRDLRLPEDEGISIAEFGTLVSGHLARLAVQPSDLADRAAPAPSPALTLTLPGVSR